MAIIFGTAGEIVETTDGVTTSTPDLSTALFGAASAPIALVAANLFVVAFGMSWGPVVWVLLGEMFPNRMRAAALSLAAGGQWVANWLVTVSFPVLRDFSLGFAYGLYALFALLSFFFVTQVRAGDKGQTTGGHARLTRAAEPPDLRVGGFSLPGGGRRRSTGSALVGQRRPTVTARRQRSDSRSDQHFGASAARCRPRHRTVGRASPYSPMTTRLLSSASNVRR